MKHLGTTLLFVIVFATVGCNQRVQLPAGSQSNLNNQNQVMVTPTPTITPTPTPGNQRWQSNTSHVWATLDRTTNFNATASTVLMFDNVIEDPLQEYNKTTGIFAPKAGGLYSVHATLTLPGPWQAGDYCKMFLSKAMLTIAVNQSVMPTHQNQCVVTINAVVPLAVGEGVVLSSIIAGAQKASNQLQNNPYVTLQIAKVAE